MFNDLPGTARTLGTGPNGPGTSPPRGFLPDQVILAQPTVIELGAHSYQAYNFQLAADADVFGSYASSGPVDACLLNASANAHFGSGGSAYGSIPGTQDWTDGACEWDSGSTVGNTSFDAYVVGGPTTLVFLSDDASESVKIQVTTDLYATFDEY